MHFAPWSSASLPLSWSGSEAGGLEASGISDGGLLSEVRVWCTHVLGPEAETDQPRRYPAEHGKGSQ